MKRNIIYSNIILATLFMSLMPMKASAQRVNSLYFLENTPMHTQWNPAMAPKYSCFGIGASNISIGVQSDLAMSDLFIPSEDGSELYTFGHPSIDKNEFINGLKDVSTLNFNSTINIFNLGLRLKNNYLTLHSGLTFDGGMGLPKDFFRMFMLGMDSKQSSTQFNLTDLNINAMAYAKFGVGYSMKIGKMLSVGINANYLQGIADFRMGFDNLTVDASDTQWNVNSKGYLQMAGPDFVKFGYNEDGYVDNLSTDDTNGGISGIISSMPNIGNGFSIDLGVTAKPLPFLTLSAAITDLGSITWNGNSVQRASSDDTFTYDGFDFDDENSADDISEKMEALTHFEKDNSSIQSYSSKLTTKINLGAEASILNKHVSFGVLSQTGIAPDGTYQNMMLSANLKPSSIIQGALTYSLLHGEVSMIGAALNAKLAFINIFAAADCIPTSYSPQMIPVNASNFNLQFGFNMMF